MRDFIEKHIEIICCPFWWMLAFTILMILLFATACSWQGQRHPVILPDNTVAMAEWWSMRLCWMSNGIEAFSRTPYWETGFKAGQSQSDPNSITAAGTAAGEVVGQAARGAVR